MITVATIVAVTFASWPVYSCWLPSLSAFTLCSLTPVIVAGAVQFGVSQTPHCAHHSRHDGLHSLFGQEAQRNGRQLDHHGRPE